MKNANDPEDPLPVGAFGLWNLNKKSDFNNELGRDVTAETTGAGKLKGNFFEAKKGGSL